MKIKTDWQSLLFDPTVSFATRFSKVFQYQLSENPVYRDFCKVLGLSESSDISPETLPLLPIRAFRLAKIYPAGKEPELRFISSGTSAMERSTHFVADRGLYQKAISDEFNKHFPLKKYALLCYMPGYMDNEHSSLIWMAKYLVDQDPSGLSTFVDSNNGIRKGAESIVSAGKTPLLFGAAYGLIDLAESENPPQIPALEIIETGGMKTYRREITKTQLRKRLSEGFKIDPGNIHSEYGMCELLSQMYAIGDEWFTTPHWVHVTIRKSHAPSQHCKPGEEGKIGITDLANVHSCPFILTDDRGVMAPDGRVKVLGRWNPDDLRGCNFLIDRD